MICTGGEEGEIRDPDLDPVADKPRLLELRTKEVKDACGILGVAELRMLGFRDSGMAATEANQHPDAFVNAERSEAACRLVQVIRELRPRVIVTEPPGGAYPHPDHIMCATRLRWMHLKPQGTLEPFRRRGRHGNQTSCMVLHR